MTCPLHPLHPSLSPQIPTGPRRAGTDRADVRSTGRRPPPNEAFWRAGTYNITYAGPRGPEVWPIMIMADERTSISYVSSPVNPDVKFPRRMVSRLIIIIIIQIIHVLSKILRRHPAGSETDRLVKPVDLEAVTARLRISIRREKYDDHA